MTLTKSDLSQSNWYLGYCLFATTAMIAIGISADGFEIIFFASLAAISLLVAIKAWFIQGIAFREVYGKDYRFSLLRIIEASQKHERNAFSAAPSFRADITSTSLMVIMAIACIYLEQRGLTALLPLFCAYILCRPSPKHRGRELLKAIAITYIFWYFLVAGEWGDMMHKAFML